MMRFEDWKRLDRLTMAYYQEFLDRQKRVSYIAKIQASHKLRITILKIRMARFAG